MSQRLLGDIGGTYARFALVGPAALGPVWSTEVSAHASVIEAIGEFLKAQPHRPSIAGAVLAAAGPVEGGRCKLTNALWTIDEEEVARAFDLPSVRIVNDLEAVAAGLPDLSPSQSRPFGPEAGIPGAPIAIVAPGTGFGMACLFISPAGRSVISGEGGHASMPAIDDRHEQVIASLRRRFGHVSIERVLSGAGLVNLYQAIAAIEGARVPTRNPGEVTGAALDGSCPISRLAVDTFCSMLGAVAGDAALAFGARGGVFIGGGIVPRFVDHLAHTAFRASFAAKGRLEPYLARIPTRVIMHPTPAFLGLMSLVRQARR